MSHVVQADLRKLFEISEGERRCLIADTNRLTKLARRALHAGWVVSPYRGLYARRSYWDKLSKSQQSLCVIRALAKVNPSWVFCDASAALIHGLYVSHRTLAQVHIATSTSARAHNTKRLTYHVIPNAEIELVDGIQVTSLKRTAFDCMRSYDFKTGLAIADSALRVSGMTQNELRESMRRRSLRLKGRKRAIDLTYLANPLSESGGESYARATMIELGFLLPKLQVPFVDPLNPNASYRVDYLWQLANGELIAGELDGREKYRNPIMTGGKSALDILADERLRESRISASGASVVRFSFADVLNESRFARLLSAYGIPRVELKHKAGVYPVHLLLGSTSLVVVTQDGPGYNKKVA